MSDCQGTYNVVGSYAYLGKTGGCGCECGQIDPCQASPTGSDGVVYTGPNLPCTGVNTCDKLTVALQKIDAIICEILDALYNLTTTTTTTIHMDCSLDGTIECYTCAMDGVILCP